MNYTRKAKYLLNELNNLYKSGNLGGPGLTDKIEEVLENGGDAEAVAQAILETHVLSFGDNREELAKFKDKVVFLCQQ